MFVGLVDTRGLPPDPPPEQPWRPDVPWRLVRWMFAFSFFFVVGVAAPGWIGFGCLWIATAIALAWAFHGLFPGFLRSSRSPSIARRS